MSDLGKRVAVAALGVPAVLALLFYGGWYLAAALAVLAGLGTHEVYRFAAEKGVRPFVAAGIVATGGLVLLAEWAGSFTGYAPAALAVLGGVTAFAVAGAIVGRGPDQHPLPSVAITLFGVVYVGLALSVVPLLHGLPAGRGWFAQPDPWAGLIVVALPLGVTWLGDSAAYFAGTAWGKAKLAPTISPKKSWVGFWAEVLAGVAVGALWHTLFSARMPGLQIGPAVTAGLGGVIAVGAVGGDLVESLLKREAGVKDSGNVFPGHGGVLDRLDALLVTLPLAYVVLASMGGAS